MTWAICDVVRSQRVSFFPPNIWLCHVAGGILVPQQRWSPRPPYWKSRVRATGPLGSCPTSSLKVQWNTIHKKRTKISPSATARLDLEGIMRGEGSQGKTSTVWFYLNMESLKNEWMQKAGAESRALRASSWLPGARPFSSRAFSERRVDL